jgi:hypothetical protein
MRAPRYLALVAGTLALCLTLACSRDRKQTTGEPQSASGRDPPVLPDTASDPGAQVARRIVKAATLHDAVSATRDALTRGGLAISGMGGTTQPAAGPPSPFIVLPPEAVLLAFEARQRATHSRLTLDQFGAMLADFGWPFTGEGMPGDQLMRIVAAWVRAARAAPHDSLNFTPLFLADMGRRQLPSVDLASDSTDPGEVRLGFLEMQLVAAALTRGLGTPVKTGHVDGAPIVTVSYGARRAVGPCDDAKDWFGKTLTGGAVGAYGGWGVGQALEKALEASGLGKASVGAVTKALDAVATGMKIIKLGELYGSTQVDLNYASEMPAHRPEPGEDKYASVRVRAGISAQEYEEYKRSLKSAELAGSVRNCLETLGLPSWSDLADVASDAAGWLVKWNLGKGAPKHAVHARERNDWYVYGQRIMQMKRASETSSEATYTFKLTPEARTGHPGNDLRGQVHVTAELRTAKPPGVSTVTDAMLGIMGLVKALADLGIGWFQTVVTPEAGIMVPIVYHEPGVSIMIEDENQVVLDFRGKKRLFGMVGAKTAERSQHIYEGEIHLGEDSLWHGQVRVMIYGTYIAGDSMEIKRRAAKYANLDENASFEDAIKAIANFMELMGDIPSCNGSYEGAQIFAVEGSFTEDKQEVELAFIPVGPPEYYHETPNCQWGLEEIEGIKSLPLRIPFNRGQETAIVIDAPKPGETRVYPEVVKMKDIYGSTVITVSDERVK